MKAPILLDTERLTLRRPTKADVQAIFERYASSPAVTRYLGWPRHRTQTETDAFLAVSDAAWARWPAGPYLITDRESGAVLGGTGLGFQTPTSAVTGYVLAEDAWGQGFATETLRAIVALATRLGLTELTALCHPEHRPSQRVLEKCGFQRVQTQLVEGAFPNLPGPDPGHVLVYSKSLGGHGVGA